MSHTEYDEWTNLIKSQYQLQSLQVIGTDEWMSNKLMSHL